MRERGGVCRPDCYLTVEISGDCSALHCSAVLATGGCREMSNKVGKLSQSGAMSKGVT